MLAEADQALDKSLPHAALPVTPPGAQCGESARPWCWSWENGPVSPHIHFLTERCSDGTVGTAGGALPAA
eukprot:364783-Chlamydomonas_euryale.AAC.2